MSRRSLNLADTRFATSGLIWALAFAALLTGVLAVFQPVVLVAVIGVLGLTICLLHAPQTAFCVLLILAPLRTLIATESAIALPLDIGQLLLIVVLGIWAAAQLTQPQRRIVLKTSPVLLPILLFFAAITLSAGNALSMATWLNEWLKWTQILVIIVICLHFGEGQGWQWLLMGLAFAGIGNAMIGTYEFFGGSGALHLLISPTQPYFRAFGTFGQPNPFGGFMGLLTPLLLFTGIGYGLLIWRRWQSDRSINRLQVLLSAFYLFAGLFTAAAVILSWSRGAWLALGVALAAACFALPRFWWQRFATISVLILLGGGLVLSGRLPASISDRIASSTAELFAFNDVRGVDISPENYAVVERLAHWQAALNMASENPWLGVGFGNYEIAYPTYRLINWKFPLGHAHNYYLNVLAEAGIIGLVTYLGLWVSIIGLTWRASRHPNPLARAVLIGLLGTWVYLAVHSLTDNLYVNNLFLHLGVMLGILAVLYNQVRVSYCLRTR